MPGSVSERADRIAAGVRRDRDPQAGDQRAALRARPPRVLINYWSAGSRAPDVSVRLIEVNGGREGLFLDGQQRLIGVLGHDIAGGRSQAPARLTISTSSRISGPSPTSDRC